MRGQSSHLRALFSSSCKIETLTGNLRASSENVTARREGRGWKPSWDDDWGGSKSSKTAQPTFYPTLSLTSRKSSKSSWGGWGGWSHDDDDDDWKGWRAGGSNKKEERMKKEHHARQTGRPYHGAGRDLVVEIEVRLTRNQRSRRMRPRRHL
eukprot:CCRYP_017515-RA/>CCRYP_017515-RA protein AED:0.37 eAED:0.46 QI:0/0.5/0.33/1/1/1/3/228/151